MIIAYLISKSAVQYIKHFINHFAISFSFSGEVDYKSKSLDKLLKKQDASWYLREIHWLMQISLIIALIMALSVETLSLFQLFTKVVFDFLNFPILSQFFVVKLFHYSLLLYIYLSLFINNDTHQYLQHLTNISR